MEETQKSNFYPNEFDWWELPDSCPKCTQPFHIKSGQDIPFCPNCVIDRANAKRGRETLERLRERMAGAKPIPFEELIRQEAIEEDRRRFGFTGIHPRGWAL
jgi:uncharacterized Zn finger protein (UPF0148 family)